MYSQPENVEARLAKRLRRNCKVRKPKILTEFNDVVKCVLNRTSNILEKKDNSIHALT